MEDIMSICREHTTLTAMQQELLKQFQQQLMKKL